MLYPLVFEPILKPHLWGGRKLERLYRKPLPAGTLVGESWEVSDRPDASSVIANGPLAGKDLHWLMENHGAALLGHVHPANGRFPLLVKILDCTQAPSLQVHPPPEVAARLGGEPKTEIWYVADAAADAHLLVGLRPGVKRLQFERKIGDGNVLDCLHRVRVRAGDTMFVPSGRVHSIGPGIVLFEIQQNSDTTFRVFDWNRVGPDGQPRALQIEPALESIDYDDFAPGLVAAPMEEREGGQTRLLVDDPLFRVEEWRVPASYRQSLGDLDRPILVAVVSGNLTVRHPASGITVALAPGQVCLVPASVRDAELEADSTATYLVSQPGAASTVEPEPSEQQHRKVVPAWEAYEAHWKAQREEPPPTVLPSRRKIKRALSKHLIYSPFLKLLILNFWFRLAVGALAFILVTLALLLPKIWKTSPKDFLPVVRISLLDLVQAYSLRRAAEQATAARQYDDAVQAWRNACGNNLGNPDLARGLLKTIILQDPPNPRHALPGVQTAFWLMRLTHTNRADLELSVTLFERLQLHDLIYQHLQSTAHQVAGAMETAYVKALFFENQMPEFVERWERLTPEQKAVPELALLRAAYLAGWGPAEGATEGKRVLSEAALGNSPQRLFANRLQLAVSSRLRDVDTFADGLRRLQEAHADTGVDHAGYWRLLMSLGRAAEARGLAENYVFPPKSSAELIRLAGAYQALGLTPEALRLMKRYALNFWFSEDVWTEYAALLNQAKEWDELVSVALQMRRLPALRSNLEAISYFHEGRALLAKGEAQLARIAFAEMARRRFSTSKQALAAAHSLTLAGQHEPALQSLTNLATTITNVVSDMDYWEVMFLVATALRDEARMLEAARTAYLRQPRNVHYLNRYAATLLIEGTQADEAVRVTLDLVAALPTSKAAQINHALALLLNRRPQDAQEHLERIIPEQLTRDEFNTYRHALFQLKFQQQQFMEAADVLSTLDLNLLYPSERRRLDALRDRLPPPSR